MVFNPIINLRTLALSCICLCIHTSFLFAQEVAFTNEVTNRNGLVYHQNKPFTGELYAYNDNAKADCYCTLKAEYKYGKLDGLKQEWYLSGAPKFKGSFNKGTPNGEQIQWLSNGKKKERIVYDYGRIRIKQNFDDNEVLIFEEQWDSSFKNKTENTYYSSSILKQEVKYNGSTLISTKNYNASGNLIASENRDINTFENLKKEYDADGNIKREVLFNRSGQIIQEGNYTNNKKNGKWIYQLDDETKKIVNYDFGQEVSSKTIKNSHLLSTVRKLPGYRTIRVFKTKEGKNIRVAFFNDDTMDENKNNRSVGYSILGELYKRLERESSDNLTLDTTIDQKIYVQNISVDYKTTIHTNQKGKKEAGYDAFINCTLLLKDADNNLLAKHTYRFNKSNKLLNSLFNKLASTYSKSKQQAFLSSYKKINVKDFLVANYPIPMDFLSAREKRRLKNKN